MIEKLWSLDDTGRLLIEGAHIDFTPMQAALLGTLLRANGRVVTKDALIQAVWPLDEPENASRTLDVHLHNIREKLKDTRLRVVTRYGWGVGAEVAK